MVSLDSNDLVALGLRSSARQLAGVAVFSVVVRRYLVRGLTVGGVKE